ncbi:MAG: C_GCAxxG_C_C family protein [Dehalococcoidia bacterium]|nr:C_GCAxxG_C_C family protein [Dehalococcoidia bacterium]
MLSKGSKEEILDQVAKRAGDQEELLINCAQGTLAALQEEFNLGEGGDALKAATFMPGLVSRKQTCGAVIGGLMALGLAYGRNKPPDSESNTPEAKEKAFKLKEKAWRFCEAFEKEFGSTMCGDIRPKIMGREYNTMDPKEIQKFLEDDGAKKCRVPPEKAARIAASIMLEK